MFRSLIVAALVGGCTLAGSAAPAEAGGVRVRVGPRGYAVRTVGPHYVARPVFVRPVVRPVVVRPRYVAPVYAAPVYTRYAYSAPVYAAPVYSTYSSYGYGYGYASPSVYVGGWYGY